MCKVGSPCYCWNWLYSDMINSWKFGKICWFHISIKIVFQLSLQKDLRILFWSCLIHSWIAGHSPCHTNLPEKAVPFSCAETSSRLSGYQVHVLKCTVILNTLSHLKKEKIKHSDINIVYKNNSYNIPLKSQLKNQVKFARFKSFSKKDINQK